MCVEIRYFAEDNEGLDPWGYDEHDGVTFAQATFNDERAKLELRVKFLKLEANVWTVKIFGTTSSRIALAWHVANQNGTVEVLPKSKGVTLDWRGVPYTLSWTESGMQCSD